MVTVLVVNVAVVTVIEVAVAVVIVDVRVVVVADVTVGVVVVTVTLVSVDVVVVGARHGMKPNSHSSPPPVPTTAALQKAMSVGAITDKKGGFSVKREHTRCEIALLICVNDYMKRCGDGTRDCLGHVSPKLKTILVHY